MSNVDQLEREVARQLDIANSLASAKAKIEERRATRQAAALVREQAKEQVKAMLNKPVVKHQTQLPAQPEVKQTKLQLEQPQQPEELAKKFDDQMTKINELLVSLGGTPIVKAVTAAEVINTPSTIKVTNNFKATNNITNPDALNVVEEQYRTSLITNMIQLIHSKRKK